MTEYPEQPPPQAQDAQKRTAHSVQLSAGSVVAVTSVQTVATSVEGHTRQRVTTNAESEAVAGESFPTKCHRFGMKPSELNEHEAWGARQLETISEQLDRERNEAARRRRKEKTDYKRDWKNARRLNRERDRADAGPEAPPKIPTLDYLARRSGERTRYENKRRKLAYLRTMQAKALKPYNAGLSNRMYLCERIGREYTCVGCGSTGIVPVGCNVRGCPACESKKADKDTAKYGACFEGKRRRLITFTLQNTPVTGVVKTDADALRRALRQLSRSFRAIRQDSTLKFTWEHPYGARKWEFDFRAALAGGLWKREVTVKCDDETGEVWWHVHLHVLYWGAYIPQDDLSAAWHQLTGARIVDIRECKNLREIVKYACKAFDYEDNHHENRKGKGQTFAQIEANTRGRITAGFLLDLWQQASRRLRLIQTFGEAYAVADPEDGDPQCPDCGGFHFQVRPCVVPYLATGPPAVDLWRGADLYKPPPKVEPTI